MSLFPDLGSERVQGPRRLTNAIPRLAPDRKQAAKRVACADQDLHAGNEAWFEIYRAERVTLTSILFSGEDWRWRFCSNAGLTIASGAGFRTEGECIAAVDALRRNAGAARVRGMSARPS
jgi:uncharacterized protein YegP (UPF0339 family)